jgi:methylmalonyl-CoA mutase
MEAATITRTRFPAVSIDEWSEGLAVAPLSGEPWHVRASRAPAFRPPLGTSPFLQRIDDSDPEAANRQARAAIDAGAGGLAIVFEGAANAFGAGLPADPDALATALDGLPLTRMRLRLDPHPASRQSVDWLVEIVTRRRLDASRLSLAFGLDPAAIFASSGRLNMSLEAMEASLPQSIGHFFALGVPALLLEADGRVVHNAGACPARELGVALAAAVSHLRMFEMARQPLVYAAPHIGFTLAVDADFHLSAIKLATLRELWRRAQAACGIEPSRAAIHAASSFRLLDGAGDTALALALAGATVGGADTVAAHRPLPDGMAGLLRDALSGAAAFPPTAPSGDVAHLAHAAWEEFLAIEAEGGLLYSLAAGALQHRVAGDRHLYDTGEPADAGEAPGRAASPAEGTFGCEPLLPAPLG